MDTLISNIKSTSVLECVSDTTEYLNRPGVDRRAVYLTLVSLLRFGMMENDKPTPESSTDLKEAIIKTGAYYFGPLFVLDKGTSIPSTKILQELERRGFFTQSLRSLNNAQLNLFFITLKSMGLVSDKHLISYMKYSS